MVTPSATQTSIAASVAQTMASGAGTTDPKSACITVSATSAPTITRSPCAKLMSPSMP